MAYTLTQMRSLLTTAELELFDQSRTQNVKAFSAKQIDGKLSRARKLRDKFRDLYQRQTVASRKSAAGRGASAGTSNERTQRKAEVFDEVLGRFEARQEKLLAQEARATASTKSAASKKSGTARPTAKKTGGTATRSTTVRKAVKSALAKNKNAAAAAATETGAGRSAKAPSPRAPRASASAPQLAAPLDMVPKARRTNPVKLRGGSIGIDAHTRVQVRHAQAKRDSR